MDTRALQSIYQQGRIFEMKRAGRRVVPWVGLLMALVSSLPVQGAERLVFPDAVGFGIHTPAGTDGRVIRVTNLKPEGRGSLKEAIETEGARLVVFDVGGVIDMQRSSLKIRSPFITIAGQTAPSPGITIVRGGISVRTHDVLIQHIRVRPGDAEQPKRSGWEVDGIGVTGEDAFNVIVDHCSLTWAVDENLSSSGPNTKGAEATSHRVTFSNNIIAEALHDSSHAKGPHSMGSLIHDFSQNIAIIGNLYAHNNDRNPYFKAHTTGVIVNNLIYNPGAAAIKLSFAPSEWKGAKYEPENARVSIVGNVFIHGADTRAEVPMVFSQGDAYMEDNLAFDAQGKPLDVVTRGINILESKPSWFDGLKPIPGSQVVDSIVKNVGARPWDRDEVDKRVIKDLQQRKGRIIDSQQQVGGYPNYEPTRHRVKVPKTGRQQWLASFGSQGH